MTVGFTLFTEYGQEGIFICNIEYPEEQFIHSAHSLTKSILSFLVRGSDKIQDFLMNVDWEQLKNNRGYDVYIDLKNS